MEDGACVHPTCGSLDHALKLLRDADCGLHDRAAQIIEAVMSLQDVDPLSATYGTWPHYLEEPLEQMRPADLNWADFCGARLAEILVCHHQKLPGSLVPDLRVALGHASWSIFRRNVGPGYTNIAFMGATVTLAAGEVLDDPRLLDYGRRRLNRLRRHAERAGGFSEYNSPTYTLVALDECDRILALVVDPAARGDAEFLRRMLWTMIAEHYHPGTCQWAGPHSRAYGDHLFAAAAAHLSAMTGVAIRPHPRVGAGVAKPSPLARPCPDELLERFRRLPESTFEIRRRFIRRDDDAESVYGTTWFAPEACLGSVTYASLRDQRRPLLGYWHTADDPAVCLRLRFLHDGYDFSSALVRCRQSGPRVLAGFNMLTNLGDRAHQHDPPRSPGVFAAEDFRVRLQIQGVGATARRIDAQMFELSAGDWRAVIHAPPGNFAGNPVCWEIAPADDGWAAIDGVCHRGGLRTFDFNCETFLIGTGVELLRRDQPTTSDCIRLLPDEIAWDAGVNLRVPAASKGEAYSLL